MLPTPPPQTFFDHLTFAVIGSVLPLIQCSPTARNHIQSTNSPFKTCQHFHSAGLRAHPSHHRLAVPARFASTDRLEIPRKDTPTECVEARCISYPHPPVRPTDRLTCRHTDDGWRWRKFKFLTSDDGRHDDALRWVAVVISER